MAINEATLINAAVHSHLLTVDDVNLVRKNARHDRLSVLDAIGRDYRLPRASLYQAVAQQRQLKFLPLAKLIPDQDIMSRLPSNLMVRRLVLPVRDQDMNLLFAMADPDDQVAVDTVKRVIDCSFDVVLSDPISLQSVLDCELGGGGALEEDDSVTLFDELMKEAYVYNASDIHLKPEKGGLKASLRVDGRLIPYHKKLNTQEASLLINRVKVLGHLDISEQRVPQDGGFSYAIETWKLPPQDLRVGTLPSRWGERITLRILGQESEALSLGQLGFESRLLERLRDVLTYPHGMVLVVGPTGSGKSTTLYAALREIDRTEYNVLTVEDPIEQLLAETTQVQVGVKINFSQALRSFLRHDPDIILVGEVRDQDTAETAMKAAMTGHLVLSTLHTNNAINTVGRLRNLGCEDFMIASTVRLVIAQRLVRRLCRQCREPVGIGDLKPNHAAFFLEQGECQIYRAEGCPACLNTGYKGRIGLHEMFLVDSDMSQRIADGASEQHLRTIAGNRLYTLWQDALNKVAAGETSLEEVLPFYEDIQTVNTKDEGASNVPMNSAAGTKLASDMDVSRVAVEVAGELGH